MPDPEHKQKDGLVTFGVEKPISEVDAQFIAGAVMCSITCSTNERGDIATSKPLYEFPLLKRLYARRGGVATISDAWLYHPKKPGLEMTPRWIPLRRLDISTEMNRLQQAYSWVTAAGKQSDFDKVYGVGIANRFKKAVIDQAKAYKALRPTLIAEKRGPSLDELVRIANLAEPAVEGEADLEAVMLEDVRVGSDDLSAVVDDGNDVMTQIQNIMIEKGSKPEVALAVAALHSEGKATIDAVRLIPALVQKTQEINDTMRYYKDAVRQIDAAKEKK